MRLVVIEIPGLPTGATQKQEFDLQPDPANPVRIIGRQLGSHIHLIDPSVSRGHAELTIHPDGLMVRDKGSANGTFINDRRLIPDSPMLLRPGERLRVGNVVTLLESGPLSDYLNSATTQNASPLNSNGTEPYPAATASPAGYGATGPLSPRPAELPSPPQVVPAPDYYNPAAASGPAPMNYQPYQPMPPTVSPPQSYAPSNYAQPAPQPQFSYNPAMAADQAAMRPEPRIPTRPVPVRKPRARSGILLPVLIILLAAIIGGGVLLYFLLGTSPTVVPVALPVGTLPSSSFAGPPQNETVQGLNVTRPGSWKKAEVGPNQLLYYRPETPKTVLNIELPPSPSISTAGFTPEMAVKQYLVNVRANASKVQVTDEPATVKLKDGTSAVIARLIFSTDGTKAAAVTDYNMTVISFSCGAQLHYVSAAGEAQDLTPQIRQDLDGSIANLSCNG